MKKIIPLFLTSLTLLSSFKTYADDRPYLLLQGGLVGSELTVYHQYPFGLSEEKVRMKSAARIAGGYLWEDHFGLAFGVEAGIQVFQDYKEWVRYYDYCYIYNRFSLDALGVVEFRLSPDVIIFAKGGMAYVDEQVEYDGSYNVQSHSRGTGQPKSIFGIGYDLTDYLNVNLALNTEYQTKERDLMFGKEKAMNVLMMGIQYYL